MNINRRYLSLAGAGALAVLGAGSARVALAQAGHSAGRIETKAEFIAASTSGKSSWNFITLSEPTVKVVGDNAIARHVLTGETLSEGKTTPIKIGILMVWQKQGGDWKLLARQAYRI
jgi:hypothetical protein